MAFFTLVYCSPKESSLELTIVGPLGLNGFLHLGLLFGIFHPTNRGLYLVGGVVGGWEVVGRIFGSNFDFFQSCLEVVLKLFGHCFWTQRAHTFV